MPQWWDELAAASDEAAPRWSKAWYERMNELYLSRFPDSDERSKTNMREAAERATP